MHTTLKLRLIRLVAQRLGFTLCLLGFVSSAGLAQASLLPAPNPVPHPVGAQSTSLRRVNIPRFPGAVDTSQMAIFWFGVNENPPGQGRPAIPGRNYVDVRMAYSPASLVIWATITDYYVWYGDGSQPTQDDSLAVYLDTNGDRAATPQADDYYFVLGAHNYPTYNAPDYKHQAHGTGAGWSPMTTATFTDTSVLQWSGSGPNDNSVGFEYGWIAGIEIPWSQLGRSGPPADGTHWGLGVVNYDRDDAVGVPGAITTPVTWPEAFNSSSPSSWGDLDFGLAHYSPPAAVQRGTTLIRTGVLSTHVDDSWMGGGGSCAGGHNGGSTINHGSDTALFVGSEILPTHFPCFNKSYLRFPLTSLPLGKVIISATLTLHQWGSAGDPTAPNDEDHGHDSYVWLSSVVDPWNELDPQGIQWNNAPLPQQNLSVTRIPTWTAPPPIVWPGQALTWDATQLVADAYAAGQPASMALYDAATGRNTSKYLTSSDVPDWDIEGRPRLDIVWGDPLAQLTMQASAAAVRHGTPVTYTLLFSGMGLTQTMMLTDTLPSGFSAPSALQSSFGSPPTYDSITRQITWNGMPDVGQTVTVSYQAIPTQPGPIALQNTAQLTSGALSSTASATIIVDGYQIGLPAVLR
jgi:hypothetical protein